MWALNSTYIHQALAVPYPLRREAHCTGCVASEIACRDIPTGPRQGACTYVTEEPRSYLFSPRTATGWPDSQRDQHCLQLGTTLWIPYMCLRSSLDQTPGRNDDWCFRGGGVNKVGVKCVYLRPQITVIRDSLAIGHQPCTSSFRRHWLFASRLHTVPDKTAERNYVPYAACSNSHDAPIKSKHCTLAKPCTRRTMA